MQSRKQVRLSTLDLRTAQTRRDPSSKKARAESNIPTPPHFAGSWWAGQAKCSHKALPAGSTPTLLHLQALQAEPHACNTQTCNMSDTCTGTDMRKTKHQLRTYFPLRYTHACTSQHETSLRTPATCPNTHTCITRQPLCHYGMAGAIGSELAA